MKDVHSLKETATEKLLEDYNPLPCEEGGWAAPFDMLSISLLSLYTITSISLIIRLLPST